jgi:hypothetical protein
MTIGGQGFIKGGVNGQVEQKQSSHEIVWKKVHTARSKLD